MRGEIIYFDAERGTGFISGEDGNRYAFSRDAMEDGGSPARGAPIAFEIDGGNARAIRVERRAKHATAKWPPAVPQVGGAGLGAAAANTEIRDGRQDAGPAGESMLALFRRCLTQDFADFRDRARRKEYWSFVLGSILVLAAAGILGAVVDGVVGNLDREQPYVAMALCGIVSIAIFIPSIAVTVRRLHDIGLSGWFVLVGFIPSIGSLILIVFALIPSQGHDNRWGPVPAAALG